MTAGSIEGAGSYNLGGKQLTVGSNNLSTTVSGVIADGGLLGGTGASLVKTGTGTLTLTGNNTFTGGTTVNQGLLVVNGSLASGVTLSGGSLGGSGSVGGLTANNATIAPGNSIGTLTVSGNFVQNGGTYQVETNAAGQSDRINVTGSATINGTAVQVLAQSGSYARYTTYTILNATGGVSGTYSGVSSNFAFLTPTLSYDANNVYLTLFQIQGAFAAGAQTSNQYAVGAALDQANAGATGDFERRAECAERAQHHGGPGGAQCHQRPAIRRLRHDEPAGRWAVHERRRPADGGGARRHGRRVAPGAGAGLRGRGVRCGPARGTPGRARSAGWAPSRGNGNSSTLTYNFGGGAAGLDYRLDPQPAAGLRRRLCGGQPVGRQLHGPRLERHGERRRLRQLRPQDFYADALAGYAYSGNQMQRQIMIPGLQPRTANGSTGANQFFGQIESGYRVPVFAPAQGSVTPFARLQGATVTQNGFSEWGSAQSLALTVAPQTTNSLRSTLGATLAGAIDLADQRKLDLASGWAGCTSSPTSIGPSPPPSPARRATPSPCMAPAHSAIRRRSVFQPAPSSPTPCSSICATTTNSARAPATTP